MRAEIFEVGEALRFAHPNSSRRDLRRDQALAERSRGHTGTTPTRLDDLGLHVFAASIAIHCARIELLTGDLSIAEEELRRAYDLLASIGQTYLLPFIAALLAQVVYAQGRLDEAEEISRAAEELAASDDVEALALWPPVRAEGLAWQERADEAERRAREAVELIRIRAALSSMTTGYAIFPCKQVI